MPAREKWCHPPGTEWRLSAISMLGKVTQSGYICTCKCHASTYKSLAIWYKQFLPQLAQLMHLVTYSLITHSSFKFRILLYSIPRFAWIPIKSSHFKALECIDYVDRSGFNKNTTLLKSTQYWSIEAHLSHQILFVTGQTATCLSKTVRVVRATIATTRGLCLNNVLGRTTLTLVVIQSRQTEPVCDLLSVWGEALVQHVDLSGWLNSGWRWTFDSSLSLADLPWGQKSRSSSFGQYKSSESPSNLQTKREERRLKHMPTWTNKSAILSLLIMTSYIEALPSDLTIMGSSQKICWIHQ